MAYTPNYLSAFGGFNNQQVGEAFSRAVVSANPQFGGIASNPLAGALGSGFLSAGQYFTGEGGTQYKTVAGVDPNQPGWGQRVEPGWELIGYRAGAPATGRARGLPPIAQSGYAILRKQGTEAKTGGDADAPSPAAQLQIAELTEASQRYRTEAEKQLAAANTKISELSNEELQRQKATELQNRLAIQAASSQARGQAQANLRIAPGSQTSQTAGTSAFKRRRDQYRLSPIQSTAGINVPSGSVLNI